MLEILGSTREILRSLHPRSETSGGAITQRYSTPGGTNAFVLKLTPSGTGVCAFYLGGSANDVGWGVAVDGSGGIYVLGIPKT